MALSLIHRIERSIPIIDAAKADQARQNLGQNVYESWSQHAQFLDGVFSAAPYLLRLAIKRPQTLIALTQTSPESLIASQLEQIAQLYETVDETSVMAQLRQAKQDIHLITALADLAGAFDLKATTCALSDFADQAIKICLVLAARACGLDPDDVNNPVPGFFILTLGKHGQHSLNYSSDVDLVVFWNSEFIEQIEGKDPRQVFPKIAQKLAHYMEHITADGYVFRVDLRLRPDPSSTPVAVNTQMARNYFESLGQNWERAAYAKARYCAGDYNASRVFLEELTPFIWRRSLDYAGVEDIRSLATQIQSVGRRSIIEAGGHDVKLGRGGIREIEFFTQVLQLLFGGRHTQLRKPATLQVLKALTQDNRVSQDEYDELSQAYIMLRDVEHRIQMLQDEQTHTLPKDPDKRLCVAALMGYSNLKSFDRDICQVLAQVHERFSGQFQAEDTLATYQGSLVLTGVEPTPDTLTTLESLGFQDAQRAWATLSRWAAGRAKAVKTQRARRVFARYAPRLVEALCETGDPDQALSRFAAFFQSLPSGVQVLSLLVNQTELSRLLITIIGLSPWLSNILARRPTLLDVMLEREFSEPLKGEALHRLERRFEALPQLDFEPALNEVRRLVHEGRLRIGSQLLFHQINAVEAGYAFAKLADVSIETMAQAVLKVMTERHGPPPGRWAVIGFGKLGGQELSAQSDLDLVFVYDVTTPYSNAPKPLGAEAWFMRFAQRLISAWSAPTQEGELYTVDMALRPSGGDGPLAVKISRFEDYYTDNEAWTWEFMALTRARVLAGDMKEHVEKIISQIITPPRTGSNLSIDAAAMRNRLEREKPARSFWDMKLTPGGLIDIEFIAQLGQLKATQNFSANTAQALSGLVENTVIEPHHGDLLSSAYQDYMTIAQLIRTAYGDDVSIDEASFAFKQHLARSINVDDFEACLHKLERHRHEVRNLFEHYVIKNRFYNDG